VPANEGMEGTAPSQTASSSTLPSNAFCISPSNAAPASWSKEVTGVAASPDSARDGSGWGGYSHEAHEDITQHPWSRDTPPGSGSPPCPGAQRSNPPSRGCW